MTQITIEQVREEGDPVVGHKTHVDESGNFYHTPLLRSEAEALIAACDAADAKRLAEMPTEQSAISHMWDGWYRLKDFGWREICYCPKDGSEFEVIEAGSTGIFRTSYYGEWPTGGCIDHGSAILFRPLPAAPDVGAG